MVPCFCFVLSVLRKSTVKLCHKGVIIIDLLPVFKRLKQRTAQIDKDSTDAYFNKGLVYANQKNYDEAVKCFEKVIDLSPEYPYAYYSLGMCYELKNMSEKAIEYYHLYTGIETDEKMINLVNQKIKQLEAGTEE